jgi:hypothetical protein
MPSIPQYRQQTLPQSGGMPRASAVPEIGIGGALSDLGAAGMQVASHMQRQQEIDAERQRVALEKQQREDAHVEAAKVLSDARLTWTEQLLKAKETAPPGAAGLTPGVLKQFDEYSKQALADRPNPYTQKLLNEGLTSLRTQIGQDALQFEAGARIDNRVNTLEAGINKTAQAVLAVPAQRMAALAEQMALIDGMEIPPKQKEAMKERALQTIDTAGLNGEIGAARKSTKALDAVLDRMQKGEFPGVPANSLAAAEARIGNFKNTLIVQSEAAERRRLAGLDQMERRLSWYVENGRDIPPQEFASFAKSAKGTVYEGAVAGIVAEQKAVSALSLLPPNKMVAQVNELAASYGATPSKEQIAHLGKLQRYVAGNIKLLNDSPLAYAQQKEGAEVTPLDLSKPETWAATLGSRVPTLRDAAQRNGVSPKGLLPQEAAQITAALANAPEGKKAELLKTMRQGFSDDRIFRATMQQIAPDSPVTAYAGMIATRERPMKIPGFFSDETFTPGSTAGLLLAGERLLNPGKDAKGQDGKPTFPMPKDADIRLKFNSMAGEAFAGNPEAMQITYQATRAAYAALTAQKGDYSGQLNDSMLKEAIQRATGGIADINGGVVIKPWGMDDSTFKSEAQREFIKEVSRAGVPMVGQQWDRMRLQNTKGGYLVKSGTGYLLGKDGNPVLLRVNDPNDASGLANRIPK